MNKQFLRTFEGICLWLLVIMNAGCDGSLDSQGGPQTGMVSGLVCIDISVLKAALEIPETQSILIQQSKCLRIPNSVKVAFVRTVMMPGDGKYSQFEYQYKEKPLKLWISTEKVRV